MCGPLVGFLGAWMFGWVVDAVVDKVWATRQAMTAKGRPERSRVWDDGDVFHVWDVWAV